MKTSVKDSHSEKAFVLIVLIVFGKLTTWIDLFLTSVNVLPSMTRFSLLFNLLSMVPLFKIKSLSHIDDFVNNN